MWIHSSLTDNQPVVEAEDQQDQRVVADQRVLVLRVRRDLLVEGGVEEQDQQDQRVVAD
jgi:hypothetical protein